MKKNERVLRTFPLSNIDGAEQTQTMHANIDQSLSVTITVTNRNRPSQTGKIYKLIFIPIVEEAENSPVSSLENVSSLSTRTMSSNSLFSRSNFSNNFDDFSQEESFPKNEFPFRPTNLRLIPIKRSSSVDQRRTSTRKKLWNFLRLILWRKWIAIQTEHFFFCRKISL